MGTAVPNCTGHTKVFFDAEKIYLNNIERACTSPRALHRSKRYPIGFSQRGFYPSRKGMYLIRAWLSPSGKVSKGLPPATTGVPNRIINKIFFYRSKQGKYPTISSSMALATLKGTQGASTGQKRVSDRKIKKHNNFTSHNRVNILDTNPTISKHGSCDPERYSLGFYRSKKGIQCTSYHIRACLSPSGNVSKRRLRK